MLRPAAVTLIQPHHVESRHQRLLRRAEDVSRLARSFEPVHQHERRTLARIFLPVAIGARPRSWLDIKQPHFAGRQARKFSPPERARNRHHVRIAKPRMRLKLFHGVHRRDSPPRLQPRGLSWCTIPLASRRFPCRVYFVRHSFSPAYSRSHRQLLSPEHARPFALKATRRKRRPTSSARFRRFRPATFARR